MTRPDGGQLTQPCSLSGLTLVTDTADLPLLVPRGHNPR